MQFQTLHDWSLTLEVFVNVTFDFRGQLGRNITTPSKKREIGYNDHNLMKVRGVMIQNPQKTHVAIACHGKPWKSPSKMARSKQSKHLKLWLPRNFLQSFWLNSIKLLQAWFICSTPFPKWKKSFLTQFFVGTSKKRENSSHNLSRGFSPSNII